MRAKILLISNRVYQYRISVYNFLSNRLNALGYELVVLTDEVQKDNTVRAQFRIIEQPFNFSNYRKLVKIIDPSVLILFLHVRDLFVWPLLLWLKLKRTGVIYWGHGINLQAPNSRIRRKIFGVFHTLADAIILYSENEKQYISPANKSKVFVARNTLNFDDFPSIPEEKSVLRKRYGITQENIVLFVGRITREKRLDDLIDAARYLDKTIAIVIVGAGLNEEQSRRIAESDHIYYLGAVYDSLEINEIFKMSDIFSIPGKSGLGINQAMYWGLPVVTEDVRHSPEIVNLVDGVNGYIVARHSSQALAERINYLISNPSAYESFSRAAWQVVRDEASIDRMCDGFIGAISFVVAEADKEVNS